MAILVVYSAGLCSSVCFTSHLVTDLLIIAIPQNLWSSWKPKLFELESWIFDRLPPLTKFGLFPFVYRLHRLALGTVMNCEYFTKLDKWFSVRPLSVCHAHGSPTALDSEKVWTWAFCSKTVRIFFNGIFDFRVNGIDPNYTNYWKL